MPHKPVFDSSEIHTILTLLGADLHYVGYRYTEYALMLMKEDEERIHSVTKCLYPEIAKRYQTSCNSVERNIRTLSQVAWRSQPRLLQKLAVIHLIEGQPLVNFLQYFLRILAEQAIRKLKFNSRSRCHTCSSNYSSIRFKLDNSLISSHFAFFIMFMNNGFLLSASCTCDYNLSYNCDSLLSVPDRSLS